MEIDPDLLSEATVDLGFLNMAPTGFPASGSTINQQPMQLDPVLQNGTSSESASEYEESEDSEFEMDQEGNPQPAKTQDEDNLDKLIHSVFRGSQRSAMLDPTAQAGVLGESWDQSIKDVLDDLEQEDGDMSLRSGRKRKKKHRKPRAQVVLSAEVSNMLSAANAAYMTREYDSAVELLQEIIRIEPAARPAYHTLSAIHTELGNHDKSLQLDILAAHLAGKAPELWKELGQRSKDAQLWRQAVYCYTQAITSVDSRDDVDALWDRSLLLHDLGELKKATAGFHALLKINPHDPSVIQQIVSVLVQLDDHAQALELLSDAFAAQVQKYPDGPKSGEAPPILLEKGDLYDLVALQKHQGHFKDAVRTIRTGQRWFQGRATLGQAWELYEDDREYDLARKSRPNWEQEERLRWLEDLPAVELDPQLRGSLAVSRLMCGNKTEADVHTQIIRSTLDIYDYAQIYTELAVSYFDKKHYEQALDLYMDLAECEMTNVPAVWARVAESYRHLGDLDNARRYFKFVVDSDASDLNVKLQLAEVYDELGEREAALELVNEVLEGRRLLRAQEEEARMQQAQIEDGIVDDTDAVEATLFPERARRKKRNKRKLTREQRREMELERMGDVEIGLNRLRRIEETLDDPLNPYGSREWLDAASFLVDSFRETPAFFPGTGRRGANFSWTRNQRLERQQRGQNLDADADELAQRLQQAMDHDDEEMDPGIEVDAAAESWCGLTFDDWFKMTIRYACALTVNGEYPEASEVIQHMITSVLAKESPTRTQALWLGHATCAFHAGEYEQATLELRRVLKARGHSTEVLRTIQALFASGHQCWSGWSNTNMQKFILRVVKQFDVAANVSGKKQAQGSAASPPDEEEDDEGGADGKQDAFKRTKVDPYFVGQYANVLLGAKGYSSAIFYYLRLLDLFPDEPLFHLVAGCAYLLRSIQRQVDNRHFSVAQAFACFSQYRKLREDPAESNYNFGRAFHQIGLKSLAIRHYEAVLAEERERLEAGRDPLPGGLAKYTAYNLHLLYLTSGIGALAKQVSDEWLGF